MGDEIAGTGRAAREVFEEGSDILGFDVLRLDAGQLAMTRYAQPAIYVTSLAAWAACHEKAGSADDAVFAGFSLGEYAALTASGRLGFADGVRLVALRSRLMQESCERSPGAMAAVLGIDAEAIQACLKAAGLADTVFIANRNAPLQNVIAGPDNQVALASEALQNAGARRVARLAVSGAFHTPYLADAAGALKTACAGMTLQSPGSGTVYSNVYAGPLLPALEKETDPSFAAYLERHMTRPVRWVEEILEIQKTGAESYVEFGPGKVLAGLVGKILPGTTVEQALTWRL